MVCTLFCASSVNAQNYGYVVIVETEDFTWSMNCPDFDVLDAFACGFLVPDCDDAADFDVSIAGTSGLSYFLNDFGGNVPPNGACEGTPAADNAGTLDISSTVVDIESFECGSTNDPVVLNLDINEDDDPLADDGAYNAPFNLDWATLAGTDANGDINEGIFTGVSTGVLNGNSDGVSGTYELTFTVTVIRVACAPCANNIVSVFNNAVCDANPNNGGTFTATYDVTGGEPAGGATYTYTVLSGSGTIGAGSVTAEPGTLEIAGLVSGEPTVVEISDGGACTETVIAMYTAPSTDFTLAADICMPTAPVALVADMPYAGPGTAGFTVDGVAATFIGGAPGIFDVTYTVSDDPLVGCVYNSSQNTSVFPAVDAAYTVDNTDLCADGAPVANISLDNYAALLAMATTNLGAAEDVLTTFGAPGVTWSGSAVTSGGFTDNLNGTATFDGTGLAGTTPMMYDLTVTVSGYNGCDDAMGMTTTFTVYPIATATLGDIEVCSGSNQQYVVTDAMLIAAGTTPGGTFTIASAPGVTAAAIGGGFVIDYSGAPSLPVTTTFSYTVGLAGGTPASGDDCYAEATGSLTIDVCPNSFPGGGGDPESACNNGPTFPYAFPAGSAGLAGALADAAAGTGDNCGAIDPIAAGGNGSACFFLTALDTQVDLNVFPQMTNTNAGDDDGSCDAANVTTTVDYIGSLTFNPNGDPICEELMDETANVTVTDNGGGNLTLDGLTMGAHYQVCLGFDLTAVTDPTCSMEDVCIVPEYTCNVTITPGSQPFDICSEGVINGLTATFITGDFGGVWTNAGGAVMPEVWTAPVVATETDITLTYTPSVDCPSIDVIITVVPIVPADFDLGGTEICSTADPICFDYSHLDAIGEDTLMGMNFTAPDLLAGTTNSTEVCFDYATYPTLYDLTSLTNLEFTYSYVGTTGVAEGDHDGYTLDLVIGGNTTNICTVLDPGANDDSLPPGLNNDHFDNLTLSFDSILSKLGMTAEQLAAVLQPTDPNGCPSGDDICIRYTLASNSLNWQLQLDNVTMSYTYNALAAVPGAGPSGSLHETGTALPAEAFSSDDLLGEYCLNTMFTTDGSDPNWPAGAVYDLADYDEIDVCFTTGSCQNQLMDGTICMDTYCETIIFLETVYCELDQAPEAVCGEDDYDLEQLFTSVTTQGGTFSVVDADGNAVTLNGNYIDVSELTYTAGLATLTITYSRTEGNECDALQTNCTTTLNIWEPIDVMWMAPEVYCEDADDLALPTPGMWTGNGVSDDGAGNYSFDPTGLGGDLVKLTWSHTNGVCTFSQEYFVNVESAFDVAIGANAPSGEICLDAVQAMGLTDFMQFLSGNTVGAGYWSASLNGGAPTNFPTHFDLGTATEGSWTFTYTIPGDGNCGSSDSFTILVDSGCSESFTMPDMVVCEGDGALNITEWLEFDLEGSVDAETGVLSQACVDALPFDPPLVGPPPVGCGVAPGSASLGLSLSGAPSYAVYDNISITFCYYGTNPNADGDLDSLYLSFAGTTLFALDNDDIVDFFQNDDNHFGCLTIDFVTTYDADGNPVSYTAFADENTFYDTDIVVDAADFSACNPGGVTYYLYSNSAYWNAELAVEADWYADVNQFFDPSTLHEIGTELPIGANPCGSDIYVSLNEDGSPVIPLEVFYVSEGCGEFDEVDINFNLNCTCNPDYACTAMSTNTIVFLETYSADLKDWELCAPVMEFDLTGMFDGADQGGEFTASAGMVMGDSFMPNGATGDITITYCINSDSGCNDAPEDGCDTAILTINDARFTSVASACTGDLLEPVANMAGGVWTLDGAVVNAGDVLTTAGTFTLTYTVGSCSESAEITVYDTVDPIDALEPITVCESAGAIDLNALLPDGYVGNWSGFNVTANMQGVAGLGGFTLNPEFTVGSESCGISGSISITVESTPNTGFTVPSAVCNNDPVIVLSNYGSGTFMMNGEVITEFDPSMGAGIYTLWHDLDDNDCSEASSATITVFGSDDVDFDVVDGEYTRCLDPDACFELSLNDPSGLGSWFVNSSVPGADAASISGPDADGFYVFCYDAGVVEQHGVVPFTITYDVPGSCSNSIVQTVTIYDTPENPNEDADWTICDGDDIPVYTVAGGVTDNFYVTDGAGNVVYESANVFFNETQEWAPETLPVGVNQFFLYIVNIYGCPSTPTTLTYTVNALPTIEWEFGCTDPEADEDGNFKAAIVINDDILVAPYQIAVHSCDDEFDPSMLGAVNDNLFVINAGEVYCITVVDGNGCMSSVSGVRAEYAVDFSVAVDGCSEDGFVTVTIDVDENTGYGSPYEYSFDGGLSFGPDNVAVLSVTTDPVISMLVRDQKGCLSAFEIIEVGAASAFIPTATCADADGNVTISLNYPGSNYSASYAVGDGAAIALDDNATEFTVQVLSAADINISVESLDGDVGCSATGSVTVYPTLTASTDAETYCAGSIVTFNVGGGNGDFDLSINGIAYGALADGANAIAGLPSGSHTATISSGACSTDVSFTIADAVGTPTLVFGTSFESALTVCGDSPLTVTVAGGSSYVWWDDNGDVIEGATGNTYTIPMVTATTGTYTVAIDNDGCLGEPMDITPIYNQALTTTDPVITCSEDGSTYTVTFTVLGGVLTSSEVLVNGVSTPRAVSATLPAGSSFNFEIISVGSSCDPITVSGSADCEQEDPLDAVNDADLGNEPGTDVAVDVTANDSDQDVTITVCGQPSNGSIVYVGDGVFVYTPNDASVTGDEFCYTSCDDSSCDDAIVTIGYAAPAGNLNVNATTECDNDEGTAALTFSVAGDDGEYFYSINGAPSESFDINGGQGVFVIGPFAEGDNVAVVITDGEGNALYSFNTSVDCTKTAIEMLSFDGEARDNGNFLTWTTASEYENDYFTLEGTTDGINFTTIATVKGAGNSSVATSYSVLDETAQAGVTYYRVLATDFNGVTEVATDLLPIERRAEVSVTISPVPATDFINVNINMLADNVDIAIYDVTGKLIENLRVAGNGTTEISVSNYASGTYFLSIVSADEVATSKFIVK